MGRWAAATPTAPSTISPNLRSPSLTSAHLTFARTSPLPLPSPPSLCAASLPLPNLAVEVHHARAGGGNARDATGGEAAAEGDASGRGALVQRALATTVGANGSNDHRRLHAAPTDTLAARYTGDDVAGRGGYAEARLPIELAINESYVVR